MNHFRQLTVTIHSVLQFAFRSDDKFDELHEKKEGAYFAMEFYARERRLNGSQLKQGFIGAHFIPPITALNVAAKRSGIDLRFLQL